MKSRTNVILSRIFYSFSAVFLLVAILFRSYIEVNLAVPAMLLFILSVIAVHICTRCPCCRRFGLNPRPFDKNAGYCCRCGRLVEYIEYDEE